MKYLLDTCVISEVIRPKPHKQVITWLSKQDEANLYLSVLTFGEIQKGITKAPDPIRKKKLRLWLEEDLKKRFENKIIPIDMAVSTQWGAIQALAELQGNTIPSIDALIAVSGLVHNCIVVTRNTADMKNTGVELFNPWINAHSQKV